MLKHSEIALSTGNIHIVEAGARRDSAVLFLHSWPEDWHSFEKVLNLAGAHIYALALDLPGIGGSKMESAPSVVKMKVKSLSFGSIDIGGEIYEKDIVIDHGQIAKRKKSASKKYRDMFGHTPVSADENLPWDCKVLIIGTGQSESLPVMDNVKEAAVSKGVELRLMSTPEAVKHLNDASTNFILHLTC